jgi:hypothetical protein
MPVNGRSEHCPFELFSLVAKVGVGRAHYSCIGAESSDYSVATGDAWRREGSSQGYFRCEGRRVVSQIEPRLMSRTFVLSY